MFQVSLTALRKWLLRFLNGGVDGLRAKTGRGRKRKLPFDREEEFRQQVELLQENLEGGRIRGQDEQVLLKEKFCVDHALPSVFMFLNDAVFRGFLLDLNTLNQVLKFKRTLKKFQEEVAKVIPKDVLPDNIEIWFQDEARVG